jgi:hypothetical protein
MWMTIIGFLGGPVIKGLIDAYQAHLTATTTDKQTAADLAGKEIAAQTAEAQAQSQLKVAEIGHPWEPEKLAFYIVLVFFAKCVVWDTILGLGTTPALKGDVSIWAGLVMSFYFGKRTFENVARIIKR